MPLLENPEVQRAIRTVAGKLHWKLPDLIDIEDAEAAAAIYVLEHAELFEDYLLDPSQGYSYIYTRLYSRVLDAFKPDIRYGECNLSYEAWQGNPDDRED